MVLRATRQAVEVLGLSDGKLRITRQVVEVLGEASVDIPENVSNTLALTQDVESHGDINISIVDTVSLLQVEGAVGPILEDVNQNLTIIQSFVQSGPIVRSLQNTLSLTQDATTNIIPVQVLANFLGLSQSLTVVGPVSVDVSNVFVLTQEVNIPFIFVTASNTLTLIQNIKLPDIINLSAENAIILSQDIVTNIKAESIEDILGLQDEIKKVGPISVATGNVLTYIDPVSTEPDEFGLFPDVGDFTVIGLQQDVQFRLAIINRSLTSFISFSQITGRVLEETASNTIVLTQAGDQVQQEISPLNLIQTVEFAFGTITFNVLALQQTVLPGLDASRQDVDDLNLGQAVVPVIVRPSSDCQYLPSGVLDPAPILGTATLTLASLIKTLVLRNSDFGNSDTLQFTRIFRETRGGSLNVFADPQWPKIEVFSFAVSHLKEFESRSLLDFFQNTIGQEITLTDSDNRQWNGLILTPEAPVVQESRSNRTVTFEFEGVEL